jgi:beta-galactosidase
MNFRAQEFTEKELASKKYPCDLVKDGKVVVSVDEGLTGLGGGSCGPMTLKQYLLTPGYYHFRYRIEPYDKESDVSVRKRFYVTSPPEFKATGANKLTLVCSDPGATLMYALDEPENFRLYEPGTVIEHVGKIYARSEKNGWLPAMAVMVQKYQVDHSEWAVSVSSESGDMVANNAIDGDPLTFWHSRWEYDAPKHPHTYQVDMNKVVKLKGFTYLPRQDRLHNGYIKDYEFYVSLDGDNWKKAATGTFENGISLQKVLFDSPVSTRYFKLVSLSEHKNTQYAAICEIDILIEGNEFQE